MKRTLIGAQIVCAAFIAGAIASPAAAYIGPGLGLGVIASIFGAIAAFFMMLAGLVWYPVKVMLRKRRERKSGAVATQTVSVSAEDKSEDPAQ